MSCLSESHFFTQQRNNRSTLVFWAMCENGNREDGDSSEEYYGCDGREKIVEK